MSQETVEADRALKARHRAVWSMGDYPAIAADLVGDLGPLLVRAAGVRHGDQVLDVAAGTGNAAIPAALAGAQVVASDLTPELFDAGRRKAAERGVELEWREADAEALPFDDDAFDRVLSCIGVMFAPHHQPAADELVRVCRPGGTLGLISWTPQGFIGQLFTTMKPYAPPPPPGVQPPPLWGDEDHVRALLGDRVAQLSAARHTLRVTNFPDTTDLRDYFKEKYGPTMAIYASIDGDPERVAALDSDIDALVQRFREADGALGWEYLLLTAEKRR